MQDASFEVASSDLLLFCVSGPRPDKPPQGLCPPTQDVGRKLGLAGPPGGSISGNNCWQFVSGRCLHVTSLDEDVRKERLLCRLYMTDSNYVVSQYVIGPLGFAQGLWARGCVSVLGLGKHGAVVFVDPFDFQDGGGLHERIGFRRQLVLEFQLLFSGLPT